MNDILLIAFDLDENVAYHTSSNVLVTSVAFNNFYEAFPKMMLPLLNIFYQAQTVKQLEYVADIIHNIAIARRAIPRRIDKKHKLSTSVATMTYLHEAMRTSQPVIPISRTTSLRIGWKQSYERFKNWKSTNHQYRYEQLHEIVNLPRYRSMSINLWLKKNVFYSFSHRAPIEI